MIRTLASWCSFGVGLLIGLAPGLLAATPAIPDFCFLQVSDIHVSPIPAGQVASPNDRSNKTIAWVCAQAKQEQQLDAAALKLPKPAFVIATGDLTEYGVIAKTWAHFEHCFQPLDVPLYVIPGNHDNTWTSIMPIMRQRHGADNYSFDRFGCHFVGLDDSTIQEPLPNLEARTLNWLRRDLSKVPKDQPVFLFQHHPLSTTEFGTPLEQLRFLDVLRDHHVVLLLMGHGHGVRAERWNTVDSVMGGSTFGPNSGYSIISVVNGVLRVNYRYADPDKPMQSLLEKPIAAAEAPRLEWIEPRDDATVSGAALPVSVEIHGATPSGVIADIDGSQANQSALAPRDARFVGSVGTQDLLPGWHYLHVKAEGMTGESERACAFLYAPTGPGPRSTQRVLSAGMQARPVPVAGGWLVATTDGRLLLVPQASSSAGSASAADGRVPQVLCETGVEIIHAPAVVDGVAYFSSAELGVYAVALDGKLLWKRPVGAAVYGTPAVTEDMVYVGDMQGSVHAIDRRSGDLKWSRVVATFGIEMPLLAHQGRLYFGAWDGRIYAANAADGALKWSQPGPAGHMSTPALRSRYYAPADCAPVIIGARLFVADRSYRLGAYALDGKYLGQISEDVAAIGLTEDGKGLYGRGFKSIARYDAEGKPVWSRPLALGRFPRPPATGGGHVFACSDLGVLSVLDAADGHMLWQYQVSPRLHVMAPLSVNERGTACVAGMDGSLLEVHAAGT